MAESPYLEPLSEPGTSGSDAGFVSRYRSLSDTAAAAIDFRPALSRSNSSLASFVTKTMGDRYGDEWGGGALTLLDVIETFFDSRLDLFNRRLKAQSARLKSRAVELLPRGLRTPAGGGILLVEDDEGPDEGEGGEEGRGRERRGTGEKYRREVEREVERIKVKLAAKVTNLSSQWRSAQIVRTKEKVSFLFGVMSLTFTCLLYGMAPEWMPFAYTAQSAFYLPTRIWTYKKKAWHYFLFGPIASAIITWRNSLVFHSLDKVTSLFIHMYPPLVLTIIRHVYPNAEERYTGLKQVSEYSWWAMILIAGIPYILWQAAYYKFISIDRKPKIESGQRQSSFQYMLNDKRGPIGKALRGIRPEHRELWFIFGQLIYSIIFMLPPAVLLIHSPLASSIFLIVIFAVSAWNGASFYVEVFGRKFERELERLRKEMELASATGTNTTSSQPSPSVPSTPFMDRSFETDGDDGDGDGDALANSPLVLPGPGTKQNAADIEVPELQLDKPVVKTAVVPTYPGDTRKSQ